VTEARPASSAGDGRWLAGFRWGWLHAALLAALVWAVTTQAWGTVLVLSLPVTGLTVLLVVALVEPEGTG
jgi:hypothetical protein